MYKTWQNLYRMPYHPRPISSLGPKGPLDDIGISGWYGIWYGFCHVLFSMYTVCSSKKKHYGFVYNSLSKKANIRQNTFQIEGNMSIHRLLCQWASTIKIQLSMLVLYKADLIIIIIESVDKVIKKEEKC